jgi:opacity protein-like surface antigen
MNARNILLAAAAAMPILSAEAGAQSAPVRDHYVGATLGALLVRPEGVGGTDATREASARGSLGLFAGTRLGSLPVGAGWPVFAEIGFQEVARHTVPYRTGSGTSDLTASGQSVYAAVKIDFWTPGNFALYGKLGVAHTSIKASTRPGQPAIQAGGEAVGAIWALGVQYDFPGGVGLRAEWIGFEDASPRSSAGGLSAGLAYRF